MTQTAPLVANVYATDLNGDSHLVWLKYDGMMDHSIQFAKVSELAKPANIPGLNITEPAEDEEPIHLTDQVDFQLDELAFVFGQLKDKLDDGSISLIQINKAT